MFGTSVHGGVHLQHDATPGCQDCDTACLGPEYFTRHAEPSSRPSQHRLMDKSYVVITSCAAKAMQLPPQRRGDFARLGNSDSACS